MAFFGNFKFPFIDLLASSDLVVTKSGYGLIVEPACHGVRILYQARPDWPESPFVSRWLSENGHGKQVPRIDFTDPSFRQSVESLLAEPVTRVASATGAIEAASILNEMFL